MRKLALCAFGLAMMAGVSMGQLDITGETYATNGVCVNRAGKVIYTNFISAAETTDWMVWTNAAITSFERKSGGSSFSSFASTNSWNHNGNAPATAWTDGTYLQGSTNYIKTLGMVDAGLNNPYEAMTFSTTLNPINSDEQYRLSLMYTDHRNSTAMEYYDPGTGSYLVVISEASNDQHSNLRSLDVLISNVTSLTNLDFRVTGIRTGNGVPVRFNAMTLSIEDLPEPPPEPIPPTYAVDWSGTTTVTDNVNQVTRTLGETAGADGAESWNGWAFDADNEVLFNNLLKPELEFYGGAVVYSTNAALPVVPVTLDRNSVRDSSPDDTIWFRYNHATNGFKLAVAYLWEPTETTTLESVTNVLVKLKNISIGGNGNARLLLTSGGQQYISESLGWNAVGIHELSSISNLTWASYDPADLSDGGSNTQFNMDMRFDAAIVGGYSTLDATNAVEQIGLAAEAVSSDAAVVSYNIERFQVIVIPSSSVGFADWIASFNLSGSPDADPDYDYDGDLLDNLSEYGLGGDPTYILDTGYATSVATTESGGTNYLEYVYPRRTDEGNGLTYYLELTTNLVTGVWTNSGYTELETTGYITNDFESVTNLVVIDGKTNEFIRLIIE
jgi:hypothetical protein